MRLFSLAAVLVARFGLAASYLTAVTDRFGAWGKAGTAGVTWGDFQHFIARVDANPLVPAGMAPVAAWIVTVLESMIGLSLLVGLRSRTMGLASGCLLLVIATATMAAPGGIHAVLASWLLGAAGASMLLATRADDI
jgi:putative oxidoreductase